MTLEHGDVTTWSGMCHPNIKIDQVGVPIHIPKILTYLEQVTKHNIEKMRQLVINGPDKHPGKLNNTEF